MADFIQKGKQICPPILYSMLLIGTLGIILKVAVPIIIKNYKYRNCPIDRIDNMSGTEFEEYLSVKYKDKGYIVNHVGGSGDYGADLILSNNDEKVIVQAKRYSSTVGVKAVQQAISAKEFYHGSRAVVITNNYFTNNAKTMATRCGVTLIDRDRINKI